MTQNEVSHYAILRDEGGTVIVKECAKDGEFKTDTEDGEFVVELRNTKSTINIGGKIYREKDIVALLDRPIWIMSTTRTEPNRMWTFNRPSSAAAFIWGRNTGSYTLFIGKKIYSWPDESNIDTLRVYIDDLMNMEAAFFDNESCTRAVKEERINKNKWKAKGVPE